MRMHTRVSTRACCQTAYLHTHAAKQQPSAEHRTVSLSWGRFVSQVCSCMRTSCHIANVVPCCKRRAMLYSVRTDDGDVVWNAVEQVADLTPTPGAITAEFVTTDYIGGQSTTHEITAPVQNGANNSCLLRPKHRSCWVQNTSRVQDTTFERPFNMIGFDRPARRPFRWHHACGDAEPWRGNLLGGQTGGGRGEV